MTKEKKPVVKYTDKLDIPQVTLAEARAQIELSLESNQRRGCFVLVGESGLGKTQVFDQISAEQNYNLTKIHTAHWGLMGSGIPKATDGDFFDVAVPSILPKKGEKAIVLFDELNQGLKHSINMFFTMLEDGSMFNYELPDDCLVCGTMNPATAQYAVTAIENNAAIRRRVKFLYVIPEVSGLLQHAASTAFHSGAAGPAKGKPCHPAILKFFRAYPKLTYDNKAKDAGKQYVCPATIETISEDAWNIEHQGKYSLHGGFARTRYSASIGTTMTAQLTAYIKDNTVMLGADDVLFKYSTVKKKVQRMVKKSLHEPLSDLCSNVLALMFADKPATDKTAKNFLDFCMALPHEMAANMMFQMKAVAAQQAAEPYMHELMGELQDQDDWIELNTRIDASHRSVEDGLRK